MRGISWIAAALIAAAAVAGCGGGTSSSGAPPSVGGGDAPSYFSIAIPQRAAAGAARRPAYISSSTNSVTVTVSPAPAQHAATQSIACTPQPNPTTCSGTVYAPAGSDTFMIALLDGAGKLLSQGTTTVTITAAANVSVTFNPVLASVGIALTQSGVGSGTLTVTPKDADGNTIVAASSPQPFLFANGTTPATLVITATNGALFTNSGSGSTSYAALTSAPASALPVSFPGSASSLTFTVASGSGYAAGTLANLDSGFANQNATITLAASPAPSSTPSPTPTSSGVPSPNATSSASLASIGTFRVNGIVYPPFTPTLTNGALTFVFGATPALTITNAAGNQNYNPSLFVPPNAQTPVLYVSTAFSGSGSTTLQSESGFSVDFCIPTSVAALSNIYKATYFSGSTTLGTVGTTNATPATNDGTCDSANTHLSFDLSLFSNQTVASGTTFGIVVTHL